MFIEFFIQIRKKPARFKCFSDFLKLKTKLIIIKKKYRNDTNREMEFLSFILFIMNIFIKN